MNTHYEHSDLSTFPWIVSSGTLRPEDLLPAFWEAAESLAPIANGRSSIPLTTLASLEKLVGADSSESDWDDGEASETLQEITDHLQQYAPIGCYFGSSEGDGACFGFWLDSEVCDAMQAVGLETDEPAAAVLLLQELDSYGISWEDLSDAYQGEGEGDTEEQAGADFSAQYAEDCGLLPKPSAPWPLVYVDWDAAWRDLVTGDGFFAIQLSPVRWAIFRSI